MTRICVCKEADFLLAPTQMRPYVKRLCRLSSDVLPKYIVLVCQRMLQWVGCLLRLCVDEWLDGWMTPKLRASSSEDLVRTHYSGLRSEDGMRVISDIFLSCWWGADQDEYLASFSPCDWFHFSVLWAVCRILSWRCQASRWCRCCEMNQTWWRRRRRSGETDAVKWRVWAHSSSAHVVCACTSRKKVD